MQRRTLVMGSMVAAVEGHPVQPRAQVRETSVVDVRSRCAMVLPIGTPPDENPHQKGLSEEERSGDPRSQPEGCGQDRDLDQYLASELEEPRPSVGLPKRDPIGIGQQSKVSLHHVAEHSERLSAVVVVSSGYVGLWIQEMPMMTAIVLKLPLGSRKSGELGEDDVVEEVRERVLEDFEVRVAMLGAGGCESKGQERNPENQELRNAPVRQKRESAE